MTLASCLRSTWTSIFPYFRFQLWRIGGAALRQCRRRASLLSSAPAPCHYFKLCQEIMKKNLKTTVVPPLHFSELAVAVPLKTNLEIPYLHGETGEAWARLSQRTTAHCDLDKRSRKVGKDDLTFCFGIDRYDLAIQVETCLSVGRPIYRLKLVLSDLK